MVGIKRLKFKMYCLQPGTGDKSKPSVINQKLTQLEKTLKKIDQWTNGYEGYDYPINKAKGNISEFIVEEIPRPTLVLPEYSGIDLFLSFTYKICTGKSIAITSRERRISKLLEKLFQGVGDSFSRAEFEIVGKKNSGIFVRKPLPQQIKETLRSMEILLPPLKGKIDESYDGILEQTNSKDDCPQVKLVLLNSYVDLICNCESIPVQTLKKSYDTIVTVFAKSTYDGVNRLPSQVDLTRIKIHKGQRNLNDFLFNQP